MTTRTPSETATGSTLPWQQPDWDGAPVEPRPANAGPEWPADAIERVVFLPEDYPTFPWLECLPLTRYFGADGWPLETPAAVKPRLDPRCKPELRRYPWVIDPKEWDEPSWIGAFGDYGSFLLTNAEVAVIRGFRPSRRRKHVT